MPQWPRRDSEVLRPALEQLEPRVLLDGTWHVQATGAFPSSDAELAYDPAWIAQPPQTPELSAEPYTTASAAQAGNAKDWTGVLDVYVESGLLASIQGSIDTYVADLAAEGYTVSVQEWSGPAEALRDHLKVRYDTAGLEGALFVGDLPTVTYTNANDFNSQPATFVHDLYFMDLDGTYVLNDTDPDEHYDGSGDVTPEIYMSRITTSTITALTGESEVELMDRYFAKAHAYRTGTLAYEHRGILWSDNDWRYTDYFMSGDDLYEDVLNIRDDAETTRQSYIDCLGLNYESIMFMAHSGVTSHSIQSPGGGTISSAQVRDLNPREGFYNLWNCSSGKFVSPGNLICTYVYSGDYGLNAVGTTKTGSMLSSYYYYQHQAEGCSVGQAFQLWWSDTGLYTDSLKRWHYGMTMQGDPTLRPATMGDARLIADAGEDQQVRPGEEATLDGSGTYVAEGQPTWLWEQLSGPAVSIDNADQTTATVTPEETGVYVFRLTVQLGEIASTDEVTVAAVLATPTRVDLLPESDTGGADDDNLTRLDNSSPETALGFLVAGTVAGATVTLYADGAAIGSAVADGQTTLVATDGVHDLADGAHSITARQREPGQSESADSPALTVRIDTQAPRIVSAHAGDSTHVTVELDGPLNVATAEADENWSMDHGAAVTSAAMGGGPATVVLTLAEPMMVGLDYTLTVNDVEDLAGNAVAPGTRAEVSVVDPSLLVWWKFDETEGAEAADGSGNGRGGQVVGATWQPEGRIGGALYFHGDVGYTYVLEENAADYLNGLGAITVAMWVKSEETGTERGFFTTRDPPDKECMSMRYNDLGANGGADDTMKAYVQTTVDKHRTEGQEYIQTTEWQHVAMTWTSEGAIVLYADGAPQDLSYDEGSLGGATSGTEKILVGTAYKSDGDWWGLIDDFRIYDRALDAAEIAALANLDPVAFDDSAYQVDQDHTLTVDALDGVLANDNDPDDGPQPMTALLLAGPQNGDVTLEPDGSFEYTPAAGFAGVDTFVYCAYDGLEYGNLATAAITVRDTVLPEIEAWYSLVEHGGGVGEVP
ncbi:MAG: LamG-like jellyroll fold domain-containing protein, partial [Phycisphaerae bacterium]